MIQEQLVWKAFSAENPNPFEIQFGLRGNQVVTTKFDFGFYSKNIQKKITDTHFLEAQYLFSRMNPESVFILDSLYAEATENIAETQLSDRVIWVRDILKSLNETESLVQYLAGISEVLENKVLFEVLRRHRENALDLYELMTGSRFGYYYVFPGGVRWDLSEGFLDRLTDWCSDLEKSLDLIAELFFWSTPLRSGPTKKGAVRVSEGRHFLAYSSKTAIKMGLVSSVYSRIQFAIDEIKRLSKEVQEEIRENAKEESKLPIAVIPTDLSGKTTIEYESVRGSYLLNLEIKKGAVKNLELITPSHQIVPYLSEATEEESIEDVQLILRSLNLNVWELDQ